MSKHNPFAIDRELIDARRLRRLFVFDIDHTLSNAAWRDNYIPRNGALALDSDWKEYHTRAVFDLPIAPIVVLFRALLDTPDCDIVICTARPVTYAHLTKAWLARHVFEDSRGLSVPLLMRKDGCRLPSHILKLAAVSAVVDERYTNGVEYAEITVIDDDEEVCAAFATTGASVIRPIFNGHSHPGVFRGAGEALQRA